MGCTKKWRSIHVVVLVETTGTGKSSFIIRKIFHSDHVGITKKSPRKWWVPGGQRTPNFPGAIGRFEWHHGHCRIRQKFIRKSRTLKRLPASLPAIRFPVCRDRLRGIQLQMRTRSSTWMVCFSYHHLIQLLFNDGRENISFTQSGQGRFPVNLPVEFLLFPIAS